MHSETIAMPFSHRKSTIISKETDIKNARSQQLTAWLKFNNRRNTTRIQHYFHDLYDKRILIALYTAGIIICLFGFGIGIIFIWDHYKQSDSKQINIIFNIYYSQLCDLLKSAILDPTFFSYFFPYFFANPYKYQLGQDTARLYAESFLDAYLAGGMHITTWAVADRFGTYIAIEFDENDDENMILYFCGGTGQPTYYWLSSRNELNSSYPIENGIEAPFNNYIEDDWFVAGSNSSSQIISDLYIKETYAGMAPTYTIVLPANNPVTGENIFITTFDLTLRTVQKLMQSLNVTEHSRLAVTTKDDILLIITGKDQPIDSYQTEIVTKQITDLEDPVWACVSRNEAFSRKENFSISCSKNSIVNLNSLPNDDDTATIEYYVYRNVIQIGEVTEWVFIAVIENTLASRNIQEATAQFTEDEKRYNNFTWNTNYAFFYTIGVFGNLIVWCLLFAVYVFFKNIFRTAQRKMLVSIKNKDPNAKTKSAHASITPNKFTSEIIDNSHHAWPIGVKRAFLNLKLISSAHHDSKAFKGIIDQIIYELRDNSYGNVEVNEIVFFHRIGNPSIRKALHDIYGNMPYQDSPEMSESEIFIHQDEDAEPKYIESSDSEGLNRLLSSLNSNDPGNDYKVFNRNNENGQIEMIQSSPLLRYSDFDGNIDYSKIQSKIPECVAIMSSMNTFFNRESYERIIEDLLMNFSEKYLFFGVDSILFLGYMTKFEYLSNICNADLKLALMIAAISFQNIMKDKRDTANEPRQFDRSFLQDCQIVIKTARSLLYSLYESLDEEFNKERWTSICQATFEIIEVTPFYRHIEIITKSQFFITSKKASIGLSPNESMILMQFLYISSMNSFFFNTNSSRIGCSLLALNESIDDSYINCLYENIIDPETQILFKLASTLSIHPNSAE